MGGGCAHRARYLAVRVGGIRSVDDCDASRFTNLVGRVVCMMCG